jgi:hypothetical protein
VERIRFIEHRGQRVLLLDYSGMADEREMLEMVEERTEVVSREPRASVLTLADITGAHLTKLVVQRVKEANVLDHPFVRRAALVGVESAQPKGAVEAVGTFAAKHWGRFATREEALDWLIEDNANTAQAG